MNNEDKTSVVTIVGPTACGKTELGVCLSKKICGEILSTDSMQIYKEFQICTAKPTPHQKALATHHLIDIISVEENYSVSRFVDDAKEIIFKLKFENKIPILVGGTGLYIDSLLKDVNFEKSCGLFETGNAFEKLSNQELFINLKKVDPVSSKKIHINDRKRLIRANVFFENFGFPISCQIEKSKEIISPFNPIKIGINFKNRKFLYEIINNRVDEMIKNGLLEEIKTVSKMNLNKTASCAIGYKEILEYLNGQTSFDEATEKLKMATRRYAKRQITWFKRDKDIKWFFVDNYINFEELKLEVGEYVCLKLSKQKN